METQAILWWESAKLDRMVYQDRFIFKNKCPQGLEGNKVGFLLGPTSRWKDLPAQDELSPLEKTRPSVLKIQSEEED